MSNDTIVIVGMARTPMGGMLGDLAAVPSPELGAAAIKAAVERAGVNPADVDETIMGCCLMGNLGQAPARQASLGAGLPISTGAVTITKMCGSGLKAVMQARDTIVADSADIIVAGGMESMSRAPHLLPSGRTGVKFGDAKILDHMTRDGLHDAYNSQPMGAFAEVCADKYGFTREQQDTFAVASTERAQRAIAEGDFADEITPVTIKSRRGDVTVDTDEQPAKARLDKIANLRPAFKKDGSVTAANSSSISDGAAALVITKASIADSKGLKPIATIVAQATNSLEPEWFSTAPVDAMRKVMAKAGWSKDDVDLFEINEAFAVVTMAAMHDLELDHAKVNVNGGACALGHPIGASGARILITLISALQRRGLKKGIASLCIGGGEAVAMAVELNG
jgi:acetyl-CoA C-acetyltransferase